MNHLCSNWHLSKRLTIEIHVIQHTSFCEIQHWNDMLINIALLWYTKGEHPCYEQFDSVAHWVLIIHQRHQAEDCKIFQLFFTEPKGLQRALVTRAVSCVQTQGLVLYSLLYSMNKISQRDCKIKCISVTAVSRWHPRKEMLVLHRA